MKQAQWPVILKTQIGTTAKEEEEESTNHFPTKRTRSIGGKRLLGNVPLATNVVTRPMVRLEENRQTVGKKELAGPSVSVSVSVSPAHAIPGVVQIALP